MLCGKNLVTKHHLLEGRNNICKSTEARIIKRASRIYERFSVLISTVQATNVGNPI